MPTLTLATDTDRYEAGLHSFKEGDYERAASLWLSAALNASIDDARKIADGLSAVASIYSRSGRTDDEPEQLYMRAIQLRQAFLAENDQSIGIEYDNLAMFYEKREDINNAIIFLEKAVAVLDTQDSLDKENFADVYDNLAAILLEQKQLSRASQFCQKGLEIRDATLGQINPFSLKSLELLADIQDAVKPYSKSARETRMEFKRRLPQLAVASEKSGDPLLSHALLISSQFGAHQAHELISSSLTMLCQDLLSKRKS